MRPHLGHWPPFNASVLLQESPQGGHLTIAPLFESWRWSVSMPEAPGWLESAELLFRVGGAPVGSELLCL